MTLAEFQDLLDAHGVHLSLWPDEPRQRAKEFLATEPAARQRLAETQRFERLIARQMNVQPRSLDASTGRVLRALGGELPRQRGRRWSRLALTWPSALLAFDLAPARLRIAALAGVAVLGVALGLLGPDVGSSDSRLGVALAASDVDLAAVFEPEPLTGVRP